ncbi:MAG: hypothetical protein HC800_09135 [Phormidesmis sp. RL_2_1]|nr:hypothetical protein [Phormidesmis sp. RL_2_1]
MAGIIDISSGTAPRVGTGHLRPRDLNSSLLTDEVGWLQSVTLPLYGSPGGEHWGWIYQGWLIPNGQEALAIGRDASFAMVQAYENLYTFPVLSVRADGWIQVQYSETGSAWVHRSQLTLGEMPLMVESWEARLQEQPRVYFLNTGTAQALRSQPETATNLLSLIATDSLIEPLSFSGDWMNVRVTRPIANCRPLTGATVTEGWMRWRSRNQESLVWYQPDAGCGQ